MSQRYLEDKVAWVTGSSRGIGRAIAAHLAGLGAKVAVHGTRPDSPRTLDEGDSLDAVAAAIAAEHHTEVLPVCGDLTDEAVVGRLAGEIVARLGRIDILVNNAGGDIGARGVSGPKAGRPEANDPLNVSLADLRAVLDRNLMTCILCCREVAPQMMERRSGWVVNMGSIAGLSGRAEGASYALAKAAVHEYTRCLAAMLRPYNVCVNAVAPGSILTARIMASRPIDEERKVSDGTLDRYGWPEEVARVVGFLAGGDASYISGQVLRVDGGEQLWPA